MTESDGLVRLLTSRSQHGSLSRLESSEVTKSTIVPFNPSAFLPLKVYLCHSLPGCNIYIKKNNKKKTFHCLPKLGFYNTFLMIKHFFDCLGGKA